MTKMESERKTPKTSLSNTVLRQYRAIAHKLNPVVRIGGNGLSPNVLAEVDRALGDHELIKIKIAVGDRQLRDNLIDQLCQTSAPNWYSVLATPQRYCVAIRKQTHANPICNERCNRPTTSQPATGPALRSPLPPNSDLSLTEPAARAIVTGQGFLKQQADDLESDQ